jgi:hypothetical protein
MKARSSNSRHGKVRSKSPKAFQAKLRGLEPLESRHLMAGEVLLIHLDAVNLDGVTPITQVQEGQEFLLRGLVRDINTNPDAPTNGAFRVYTDISYSSSEVQPMVSEVQMLGFTGDPAGGTFTLTYNGATTAPIKYHTSQDAAQAKDIQDALNALPGLAGNVKVDMDHSTNSNLPTDRYFIRFMNGLANTNVNPITADFSNLLSDPIGNAAGIQMQTRGEGVRSDTEAFKQAFAYNAQTDGHNLPLDAYPELRQGADQPDLFDNVGGGAPLSPIGRQTYTYFLTRLKATNGGADGQLVFTNALANQQGLETLMFGLDDPLTAAQVKFSYGDSTPDDGLQIPVVRGSVTAVNDSGYTVKEDSAAVALSPSPLANDSQTGGSSLTITAVSAGSAGGTLTTINGGANVSYKPAANFSGTETFTYTAKNEQNVTGTATIQITVTPVNDAPWLNNSLSPKLASINENSHNPWGTPVWQLLQGVTDADPGAVKGMALTSANNSNGTWQYTLNGGSTWLNVGSVGAGAARLLPAQGNLSRIRFIPKNNFHGTVQIGYFAWDQTQGVAGGTYDLSGTGKIGGSTAFSAKYETAPLTVIDVNTPSKITLSGSQGYTLNSAPILLASTATVKDPDTVHFTGGWLNIAISTGMDAGDRLTIGGSFKVVNGDLIFNNSITMGTVDAGGGVANAPLMIHLNSNATRYRVEQLVRSIKFGTIGSSSTAKRTITFTVNDGTVTSQPASMDVLVA